MKPIPLAEIRLNPHSHLSALWWLFLLYRKPKQFCDSIEQLGVRRSVLVALQLYLHLLSYIISLCVLGRWVLAEWLDIGRMSETHGFIQTIESTGLTGGVAGGVAVGFALGSALGDGRAHRIASGISLGAGLSLYLGIGNGFPAGVGVDYGTFDGMAVGVASGLLFGLVAGIIRHLMADWPEWLGSGIFGIAIGIFFWTQFGVVGGISGAIGFLVASSRAYYFILHLASLRGRVSIARYRRHPVAWDDLCGIPFPGLDRILVDYHYENPVAAEREMGRLIDSYPSQRFQVLRARTVLIARRSGKTLNLAQLDGIVTGLPEGERGFLTESRRLREMIHEIAALQARLDTVDRPFLREPLARLLCREIERFRERVAGFHQPLAGEFRAAAGNWLEVAKRQLSDAEAVLEQEPTRQVFRAGDPVDREREAFVPRNAVSGEIERQVMLATGCPGIVLYGRRRTGKSTVLRNLDGFLPPQVLRANVSMQKPGAFTSLADLVATLTGALRDAVESLEPAGGVGDLRQLFRSLEDANEKLEAAGQRLLLSIDEYENLDRKIGEGVFPEDLLATLRESIQTHRHITWIFAGSHEVTELSSARWTSYLVSARTVEVEPFTVAETRLLLTEPLKHSKLWPKDDPTRPRFAPGFWGEGGIERIHAETGGWPHLVQLVAETVVDLLNDDQRSSADAEILERALDKAIVRGHTVLYELMRGESALPGEWAYLAAYRARSTQPPPAAEAVARSLRRRLLVAADDGGWRLRVPLMERWLRQRG